MAQGTTGKRPSFTEPQFEPYALAIGQLALAWNALSEQLGHLFWALMCLDGTTMERPVGIWNSQSFDRGRREILKSAAIASIAHLRYFPRLIEDVKFLCDSVEKFENERNNAVHSPLLLNKNMLSVLSGVADFVVPDATLKNQRAINLAGKDLLLQFTWCRDSILILRDYGAALQHALIASGAPWPDRPSLAAAPQKRTRRMAEILARERWIQFPSFDGSSETK